MRFYSFLLSLCNIVKKYVLFSLISALAAMFFFLFYHFLNEDISLTTYVFFKLGADGISWLIFLLLFRFLLISYFRLCKIETNRSLEYIWITVILTYILFVTWIVAGVEKGISLSVLHTVSDSIKDLIIHGKIAFTDIFGKISFVCLIYLIILVLFSKQIRRICSGKVSLSKKYKKYISETSPDQDSKTLHGTFEKRLMEYLWVNEEVPIPEPSQREESFIEAFCSLYVCETDNRIEQIYVLFLNIIHVLVFLFFTPAFILIELLAFGLGRSFIDFLIPQDNESIREKDPKILDEILNIGIRKGITIKSEEEQAFFVRVEQYKVHWFWFFGIILYCISYYINIVFLYVLNNHQYENSLLQNGGEQMLSFSELYQKAIPQDVKNRFNWLLVAIVLLIIWTFFFHILDNILEQNHFYKRLLREQQISNRDWMSIFSHNIYNEAAGITRSIDLMKEDSDENYDALLASSRKLQEECERFFQFSKTIDSMMIESEPCNLKEIVDNFKNNNEYGEFIQSSVDFNCWAKVNKDILVNYLEEIIHFTSSYSEKLFSEIKVDAYYIKDSSEMSGHKVTLVTSVLINPDQEEHILRRIQVIEDFWKKDNPTLAGDIVDLALPMCKAYARALRGNLELKVEDHTQLIAKLTLHSMDDFFVLKQHLLKEESERNKKIIMIRKDYANHMSALELASKYEMSADELIDILKEIDSGRSNTGNE